VSGRASRRKGHGFEREVAAYLRDLGYVDAHTTRSALGHDGFKAPGDVVGPVGLVIECKNVKASAWPTWIRQAQAEADGRPWVVVRKTRGISDVGQSVCAFGGLAWVDDEPPLSSPCLFGTFLKWYDDQLWEVA
jgi:hypothetical protein